MMNKKKRYSIALVHPDIIIGGGPEAITLQTIETLKEQYDLSLITMTNIDMNQLNDFYQKKLCKNDIKIISIPPPLLMKSHKIFSSIRRYKFNRFCKSISSKFDLMISMYNMMDFRRRGVQYVHDPNFDEKLRFMIKPEKNLMKKWFYKDYFYRKFYLKLSNYLSDFSIESMKSNLTLTNSEWTGKITKQFFNIDTYTVYPPIEVKTRKISWEDKECGFVCLGRIVPDKRLEIIIKILETVRYSFPNIHLHIIGKFMDKGYKKYLLSRHIRRKDWIFLEENISGESKSELLSMHKFGIHGKKNEPFGIAVAEIVKAGAIIWVPNGGGQVEITNNEQLVYNDIDDAVFKIVQVLKNENIQKKLITHLKHQSLKYSKKAFQDKIKKIVKEELREEQ